MQVARPESGAILMGAFGASDQKVRNSSERRGAWPAEIRRTLRYTS